MVENLRIVIRDAAREDLPLPGVGGSFKALQLPQSFQRAALAEKLAFRARRAASAAASA